jgi:hypothetical protein
VLRDGNALDMEASAFFAACSFYKVTALPVIKAVSDHGDAAKSDAFHGSALTNATEALVQFVQLYCKHRRIDTPGAVAAARGTWRCSELQRASRQHGKVVPVAQQPISPPHPHPRTPTHAPLPAPAEVDAEAHAYFELRESIAKEDEAKKQLARKLQERLSAAAAVDPARALLACSATHCVVLSRAKAPVTITPELLLKHEVPADKAGAILKEAQEAAAKKTRTGLAITTISAALKRGAAAVAGDADAEDTDE